MVATDAAGMSRSYLANEENFQFMKTLEAKNLLVPVVGNFAGPKAIRAVGEYVEGQGGDGVGVLPVERRAVSVPGSASGRTSAATSRRCRSRVEHVHPIGARRRQRARHGAELRTRQHAGRRQGLRGKWTSRPPGISPGRLLFIYGVALVTLFVLVPAALYFTIDPERLDLDDAARKSLSSASSRFVRLSDGYTHYELAGPPDGRVVVLAAGATVPYYIWDPTFKALVDAGFRVLRYDYYGRGFSDRPDIPFTQDLYVRQLRELLDAVRITGPFDLGGLSFGGAVITSVAAKYPDRVRSLIYVDPAFRTPQTLTALEPRAGRGT